MGTRSAAADVALLLAYGGVSCFFVYRFVRNRRPSSLACALLPSGWVVIACLDLGFFVLHTWLKWAGVCVGLVALHFLFRAEVMDPADPKR